MSLTTLDQRTALLVVDLQEGIVSLPTVHPAADIVGRAASLAKAFRAHGLPVVLINVARRRSGPYRPAPIHVGAEAELDGSRTATPGI